MVAVAAATEAETQWAKSDRRDYCEERRRRKETLEKQVRNIDNTKMRHQELRKVVLWRWLRQWAHSREEPTVDRGQHCILFKAE